MRGAARMLPASTTRGSLDCGGDGRATPRRSSRKGCDYCLLQNDGAAGPIIKLSFVGPRRAKQRIDDEDYGGPFYLAAGRFPITEGGTGLCAADFTKTARDCLTRRPRPTAARQLARLGRVRAQSGSDDAVAAGGGGARGCVPASVLACAHAEARVPKERRPRAAQVARDVLEAAWSATRRRSGASSTRSDANVPVWFEAVLMASRPHRAESQATMRGALARWASRDQERAGGGDASKPRRWLCWPRRGPRRRSLLQVLSARQKVISEAA